MSSKAAVRKVSLLLPLYLCYNIHLIGPTQMETVRGVEERKCEAYYSYGEHLRDDDNEEMRHLRRSYLRRDCPRRSTDRTQACGACNVGSIPAEGTKI